MGRFRAAFDERHWVALRRTWDNENHFLMAILIVVTAGIGAILANPDEATFASGRGWQVFADLHLGRVHPSEEQWGVLLLACALYQLTSMWLLIDAGEEVRAGRLVDRPRLAHYRLARAVWALTCSLYAALALSAWLSNPWGVFTLLLLLPSALAFRVIIRVRHTSDHAGE